MNKAMRLILLSVLPSVVQAQWTLGPPTYDYVPDNTNLPETLGVQPPLSTSPGGPLDGFDHRNMAAYFIPFTLSVPLAELQATLPPGFTALPSALGADTASIQLVFVLGQVTWYAGLGRSGPYSYAFFVATAFNTGLRRTEALVLALETSTAASAEDANAFYGPGIARPAELEEEIESEGDTTRVHLKLKDEALGLDVRADAYCPYPINLRTWTDPDQRIIRFTAGQTARVSFRQAGQWDYRLVTLAEARVQVVAKDGVLNLPGGSVRLLGPVGPTLGFSRNRETFRRTLPE